MSVSDEMNLREKAIEIQELKELLSSVSDNLKTLLAQKENSKLVMAKLEEESLSSLWDNLKTLLAQKESTNLAMAKLMAKLEEDALKLIEEIRKRTTGLEPKHPTNPLGTLAI